MSVLDSCECRIQPVILDECTHSRWVWLPLDETLGPVSLIECDQSHPHTPQHSKAHS